MNVYPVSLEKVSLSFNGGKDCTVLLHLYAAAFARRSPHNTYSNIPTLYIPMPSPFPALEIFIDDAAKAYRLDVFRCVPPVEEEAVESVSVEGKNAKGEKIESSTNVKAKGGEGMRLALEIYKEKFPGIEGIFIGTRRTDPHGGAFSLFLSRYPLLAFELMSIASILLMFLGVLYSHAGVSEQDRQRLAVVYSYTSYH